MPDRALEARVVGPGFRARVYDVVRRVPPGRVTTYGDVATVLGSPRVARHVGWALAALGDGLGGDVPWHRVINGRGRISHRGEDSLRASAQYQLLAAEGVAFDDAGRVVGFAALRYDYPEALGE